MENSQTDLVRLPLLERGMEVMNSLRQYFRKTDAMRAMERRKMLSSAVEEGLSD